MDNIELTESLDKLHKKLDKLLNITTKVAKTLHLIPVTEKEERAIQILQRKNLEIAAKVNDELNAMENKLDVETYSMFDDFDTGTIFEDVLADDFLKQE